MVQFNFAGQVCSSTLARREEAVVGDGTKHVLTIMFDNTRDETLSFRSVSPQKRVTQNHSLIKQLRILIESSLFFFLDFKLIEF